ncbi:MAG: hypothetical protein KA191_14150 [Verrucomicrobia bacterium]|jgi:hypothetical protein|nr:hypothetical protein [Verrucomicrobiota bacterium]HOI36417.1 hypothetical protein [Bacillota bacterium]MDI9381630.1 hypothetical protein [Verrucomicrobiota bacterium]NMD22045.1 hypothetical protein [Verrucomicrobiota bacterium]HOA62268.1 hypothetical protein [Verrucomicrobiota bacterium]
MAENEIHRLVMKGASKSEGVNEANPPRYEVDLVGRGTLDEGNILEAAKAANDYSVSLINGNDPKGSATLARIKGIHGLLTADHVWQALRRGDDEEHFCMVFGQHLHRFEYRFEECTPTIVGAYSRNHEEEGPDLAFIRLDNMVRVGNLKSRKSFYSLERENLQIFDQIPYARCPWLVWGAPAEQSSRSKTEAGELVVRLGHFTGVSHFKKCVKRGKFDYVEAEIPAGSHNFPNDYGGVSGGGVWIPYRLSEDSEGKILKPMISILLAGVAYYQSDLVSGHRTLFLHGPRSIYEHVIECVSR